MLISYICFSLISSPKIGEEFLSMSIVTNKMSNSTIYWSFFFLGVSLGVSVLLAEHYFFGEVLCPESYFPTWWHQRNFCLCMTPLIHFSWYLLTFIIYSMLLKIFTDITVGFIWWGFNTVIYPRMPSTYPSNNSYLYQYLYS